MQKIINETLPDNVRRWMYIVFAALGLGFGATQTAFTTAEVSTPVWLTVAFSVYLYVGGVFGFIASTNINKVVDIPEAEITVDIVPQETSFKG